MTVIQKLLPPLLKLKPSHLSSEVRGKLHHVRIAGTSPDLSCFPDFMIIGPQRTGTTWLHHNLKSHPSIFLPRDKELYYFNKVDDSGVHDRGFKTLEEYLESFLDRPRGWFKKTYDCLRKSGRFYRPKVRGEATASYAGLAPEVIREIVLLNPDIKAILMVRDPVDRAWSHARKDLLRGGVDPQNVTQEEMARFFRASGQRKLGSYPTMIANWRAELRKGHLFVGDFRAIANEPERILSAIHSFLGVPTGPRYLGDHVREKINPAAAAPIPPEADRYLRELLADEVDDYTELTVQFADSGSGDLIL